MVTKKTAKILAMRYKFLAIVLVTLAGGLVLLPKYQKNEGIIPEAMLSNIMSTERYISSDKIAHKIINQDPSFLLIDTRDKASFKKYTLPNAIHIPMERLLAENSEAILNQEQFDIVFFSDDNFYSDQAWALCNRLGYQNLHVLKGGINGWFETIINPILPKDNMPHEAFELYATRKASSMFFGVVYPDQVSTPKTIKRKPKKVMTFKKKKRTAEGGC
jgi:rhodanese-related sulfurtransferase